jgi:hypothetical protein
MARFSVCLATCFAACFFKSASALLAVHHDFDDLTTAVSSSQSVRWIFVTDCSAYHFNQGSMLLASAQHVDQPGKFTWLTYGCERDEQKQAYTKLPHPRADAWHQPAVHLKDPLTGKSSAHFQASNRPITIYNWLKDVKPEEEAIGILDPDMFFMRAVHLVPGVTDEDTKSEAGPWRVPAAEPGHGVAAMYGIGCVLERFNDTQLMTICGDRYHECVETKSNVEKCSKSYSSGPPWIVHKDDAENIFSSWVGTVIRVHDAWPELLAEQGAFGITQAQFGVDNKLDMYWMLSNTDAHDQPWDAIAKQDFDPCKERVPPPANLAGPPVWHACSAFKMPGFILHKDHIHKDLLDCKAPLIKHPPKDSLVHFTGEEDRKSDEFLNTWSVCTYTNLVNFHAALWKRQFCDEPNLEPTFAYPSHSESFLDDSSWMHAVFRRGGWSDIDYKPSGVGEKEEAL